MHIDSLVANLYSDIIKRTIVHSVLAHLLRRMCNCIVLYTHIKYKVYTIHAAIKYVRLDRIGLKWYILRLAHKHNDWNYTTVGHNGIIYMNRFRKAGKRDDPMACVTRYYLRARWDTIYTSTQWHVVDGAVVWVHIRMSVCLCARDCCWFSTTNTREYMHDEHKTEAHRIHSNVQTLSCRRLLLFTP